MGLGCLLAQAQQPPARSAVPLQAAGAASLSDSLLAKATALYYSSAKSGLKSFDCQVHPDWKKMMESARNGAAVADDDPKLAVMSGVKIVLHARLTGESTLDWQAPAPAGSSRSKADADLLDRAHRDMENTWQGLLKLWIPLVDGSLAEGLGEDDVEIEQTADGYVLRTQEKAKEAHESLMEEFDRSLTLKRSVSQDAGSTVSLVPVFQPSTQGLLASGFDATIQPAGAATESARRMHVTLEYQTVSGLQIPGKVSVELPGVVEMEFALDGCAVNTK